MVESSLSSLILCIFHPLICTCQCRSFSVSENNGSRKGGDTLQEGKITKLLKMNPGDYLYQQISCCWNLLGHHQLPSPAWLQPLGQRPSVCDRQCTAHSRIKLRVHSAFWLHPRVFGLDCHSVQVSLSRAPQKNTQPESLRPRVMTIRNTHHRQW